jgi:NAD-dependent dihydropyrimidine dehydrogenase PreA subunit
MITTLIIVIAGVFVTGGVALWLIGEQFHPMRPSTWKVLRESGPSRIVNLSVFHGYVYGRFTKQYIRVLTHSIIPRLGPGGKKWLANRYHSKVLPNELAKNIVTINQAIPLQDLERIIPFPMARDFVLAGPPDIAVLECACRAKSENPCTPTRVCMVVGQPFVDFIVEHNPGRSNRLSRADAVKLLEAEHERGHVHCAWFKDGCAGRFYAICNCCKCCCGAIEAMDRHAVGWICSSGYIAVVDPSLCLSCGICEKMCPFGAARLDNEGIIDWKRCMGCGVCVSKCANKALSLKRDKRKGIPLDVQTLLQN